jgi:AraC-like DNA-binding protein
MHQALVLWFSESFVKGIVEPHVELRPILKMLARSARALTFSDGTRRKAQAIICEMPAQTLAERLLNLLKVLLLLSSDTRAATLTSAANQSKIDPLPGEERVARVLTHLHANYRDDISIEKLMRIATLSRSSLHRLFRLQTRMTVGDYIAQLRIGHACALLLNTDKPISLVAEEVGYSSLAHFNRQFKECKHRTPRQFRSVFI